MERSVLSAEIFRFGLFEADAAAGKLLRSGVRVKIQDQPFRVLIMLLQRPGEIVTREELRQALWPDGTFVDFDGSLNVILKKLRAAIDDNSDNPRFVETVPRRGYRFIAPVASDQKDRSRELLRIESGTEAVQVQSIHSDEVASKSAVHPSATSAPFRPARRPVLVYLSVAVAITVLAGMASLFWRKSSIHAENSGSTPVQMRKSIAVLGFHSLSNRSDDAWLATALSEMLGTELSAGEKLRLVSGEDVANLRLVSPWSQTDTLDKRTTARIGEALSSDFLVLGSYTDLGGPDRGQLRIDVRMQDAHTGEILAEIAEIGSSQDLFRLVSRIGANLRDHLGVAPMEDSDEAGVLASLPLDPDAARFYALGVSKLRRFDVLAAKDLLQQASEADPKFSLAHAMLAQAWAQLGYEQKHRDEAKKALDLSADLPRAERMLVEGEYYDSIGDQDKAASVYHVLYELFPDNVDYGLRFANAESLAGHADQAFAVVRQLRALPPPSSDDPRIDLMEARSTKASRPEALAILRSAVAKASAQGKSLVYAEAKKAECMNLFWGDKPTEAPPACEEAYNIFLSAGNRVGAADTIRLLADGQGGQGHYEEAIATYQRALGLLDGLGEHAKTGAILNNMAINYASEGKLDRAEQLYTQAKMNFERAGAKDNVAAAMGNIADILFLKGNLAAAEKLYQQTLDFAATTDHPEPGYALYRLADLELTRGNVRDAQVHAQQAIEVMRPQQAGYGYLTGAMIELGEVLEAEGDLAGARAQFEQTLEMRQKMGEAELAAESQVELATLDIEEGHPERAEPRLREAIAEFEKEKSDPDASSAYTVLSRALLDQSRAPDAFAAAERAVQFSLTSSDPELKISAAVQKARVELATTDRRSGTSTAIDELRYAVDLAKKLGYYTLESEARLAFAQSEAKVNPSSGRLLLAALASDAHQHGFELVARRAQAALSGGKVVAANAP